MNHTAAAAAKSLQSCPTLCSPIDSSPPGSPIPRILQARTLEWSGLPFPSSMHESEKSKWSRSVVSDSSQPHGLQPTRLLRPWDFLGKSTGVGCHCLLQEWGARQQVFFSFLSSLKAHQLIYKNFAFYFLLVMWSHWISLWKKSYYYLKEI